MKKIAITLFMTLIANVAISQSISDYTVSLSVPNGAKSAKANVTTDSKSSEALRAIKPLSLTNEKVPGFRVCIFVNNDQNARAAAYTTLTQLKSAYPNMPYYLTYKNPDWKLMVGDCLSRSEATQLMGQLRHSFPKAFIVNQVIPLSNFTTTIESQPTTQETDVTELDNIDL